MRNCFIGDLRCWSSPAAEDDGISLLANTIDVCLGTHWSSRRLGLLQGRETILQMPLAGFNALMNQLGNVSVVDMTTDIHRIRMIKSPAEQEKLRHVCSIASAVFHDMPQWVTAGMPLDALFRQFKINALKPELMMLAIWSGLPDRAAMVISLRHRRHARLPLVMF